MTLRVDQPKVKVNSILGLTFSLSTSSSIHNVLRGMIRLDLSGIFAHRPDFFLGWDPLGSITIQFFAHWPDFSLRWDTGLFVQISILEKIYLLINSSS